MGHQKALACHLEGSLFNAEEEPLKKGHRTLHSGKVYDAEIFGTTIALRVALSVRRNNEKRFVLLDNQAAVMALNIGKSASSIQLIKLFHSLAKSVNAAYRWVPGHSEISENEEADAEARTALKDLPERQIHPSLITLAYLRRLMHKIAKIWYKNGGHKPVQPDINI